MDLNGTIEIWNEIEGLEMDRRKWSQLVPPPPDWVGSEKISQKIMDETPSGENWRISLGLVLWGVTLGSMRLDFGKMKSHPAGFQFFQVDFGMDFVKWEARRIMEWITNDTS